jgi:outer membrane protein
MDSGLAQDLPFLGFEEARVLRITPTANEQDLVLRMEGKLAGPWVAEAARTWAELQPQLGDRKVTVDLKDVYYIDNEGGDLLQTLYLQGCRMIGSGPFIGPLIQAITSTSRILGSALIGLLACGGTSVYAAPEPALRLTLRQAIERALDQNPQVRRSLLAVAQSQSDTRAARAALLPTVDAMATMQRTKTNMDTFMGGQVSPMAPIPEVVGPFNWGQIGVEARATLFDLSVWDRWRAARQGETAAQAQARSTREGMTALVVGQYLRGLRSTASVKASQSRVALAEALEKLAEDQQKHGVGTKLDTLRSQVQLQTERQRLIQAQTQLKTSLFGLAKLLEVEPGTPVELADELSAPSIPSATFDVAIQSGLKSRPEIAALDAREKAAQNLSDSARNLRMPSLVASGSFTSTGVVHEPWVPIYQLNVGVKVPLFTGGLISSRIAKAKIELDQVRQEQRDLKSQVSLEVQVAQAELESTRSEVEVANQAYSFAEEALQQARHRFEAGVSNNIEVINAQDELAKASDNQINALHRLNQANADLAKATGQMEALFVR